MRKANRHSRYRLAVAALVALWSAVVQAQSPDPAVRDGQPSSTPAPGHSARLETGPLSANRPGLGESADVVGRGILQIETGLGLEMTVGEGRSPSSDTQLRWGVAGAVELQAGAQATWGGGPAGQRGVMLSALALGAKVRLVDAASRSSVALLASVATQTDRETAAGPSYHPSAKVAWSRSLGTRLDLGGELGIVSTREVDGRRWDVGSGLVLSGDVGRAGMLFGEMYRLAPITSSGGEAWVIDGGISWPLGMDAQLDASLGRGLTAHAPSWSMGVGLAWRVSPRGNVGDRSH